jgi:hypothetical protein
VFILEGTVGENGAMVVDVDADGQLTVSAGDFAQT